MIARSLTQLLDNKFSFLGFRFGLDPIIGVIPIVGDFIGLGLSVYLLWIAHNADVPAHILTKMWRNVILDFILGLIPGVGDVADFFFKANSKNIELLEREMVMGNVVQGEVI